MTWSVAKTWDMPASTVNQQNSTVGLFADTFAAVWEELFDVWLPSRGHVIRPKPGQSKQRGWIAYHRDSITGADQPHYFWVDWSFSSLNPAYSTQLNVYEDATYTEVPGDLMTSTTNVVRYPLSSDWAVDVRKYQAFYQPIRLWVSDEEEHNFLVTYGGKLMIAWVKMTAREFYRDDYPETAPGGTVHRRETQIMPLSRDLRLWNAPQGTPTSITQYALDWPVVMQRLISDDAILYTDAIGVADATNVVSLNSQDVAFWGPKGSERYYNDGQDPLYYASLGSMNRSGVDVFYRVLVNNSEWWLIHGSPQSQTGYSSFITSRLAFKCSAFKPPAP